MKNFTSLGILCIFIILHLKEIASEETITDTPPEDEETLLDIDYTERIREVLEANPEKKDINLQIGKDFNEKRKELEKQLQLITQNLKQNQSNAAKALVNFRRVVRQYGDIYEKLAKALYDLDHLYNENSLSSYNMFHVQRLINAILECDAIGCAKKILQEYKDLKQRIEKKD